MALFDRRLLAYFDDGGGNGGAPTLLDRIVGHQRDLAQIELELCKRQRALGDIGCPWVRPRDREAWIARVKGEGCDHRLSQAVPSETGTRGSEVEGRSSGIGVARRTREVPSGAAWRHSHSSHDRNASAEGVSNTPGDRQGGVYEADRDERRAGSPRTGNIAPRKHTPAPFTAHEVESSVQRAEGTRALGATWVQVDTLLGLPALGRAPGDYVVQAAWEGHSGPSTEPRPARPHACGAAAAGDMCVIRQQLKLDPVPGAQFVMISAVQVSPHERAVGRCRLDAFIIANHEVQTHVLTPERGHPPGTALKLRLSTPGGVLALSPAPAPRAPEGHGSLGSVADTASHAGAGRSVSSAGGGSGRASPAGRTVFSPQLHGKSSPSSDAQGKPPQRSVAASVAQDPAALTTRHGSQHKSLEPRGSAASSPAARASTSEEPSKMTGTTAMAAATAGIAAQTRGSVVGTTRTHSSPGPGPGSDEDMQFVPPGSVEETDNDGEESEDEDEYEYEDDEDEEDFVTDEVVDHEGV